MRLWDVVFQLTGLFSKVETVQRYIDLRDKIRIACPNGWYYIQESEVREWVQFFRIPHSISLLQHNLVNNLNLPQAMVNDIRQLVQLEPLGSLQDLAKELGNFVNELTPYLFDRQANLQVGTLKLNSALRRSFLNLKGQLLSCREISQNRECSCESVWHYQRKDRIVRKRDD